MQRLVLLAEPFLLFHMEIVVTVQANTHESNDAADAIEGGDLDEGTFSNHRTMALRNLLSIPRFGR